MIYGQWRAERIKARAAMKKAWVERKKARNKPTWRPF